MARVKDVIVDDGWKLKPVSALLLLVAGTFSCMIVWNALSHPAHQQVARVSNVATTSYPVAGEIVVLKYDPLIQDAQREMLALGVYKGPVDGVNGKQTKDAITAYQQLNGLAQTGLATPDIVNHMKFTHKVQAAAQFTGSVAPKLDPVLTTTPQTTVIYEKAAAEAAAAAKAKEDAIKKVQVALAGMGYKLKKIDGKVNPETRAAILKYEMDNGMDMNGAVDKALTDSLKVE